MLGSLPTDVGIVWVDGIGTTLFEPFDADGNPLPVIGPLALADASFEGETAEDRFLGVTDPGGISAIRISGSGAGSVSKAQMIAELPEIIARFGDGTFEVPYTAYPLSRVHEAWAHEGRSRAVIVPD